MATRSPARPHAATRLDKAELVDLYRLMLLSRRVDDREIQLKRAHELLMGSTLSLTTIAVDAGFYDLPHFDKAFRQRLGMAPQKFRRRHGRRRNENGKGSGPALRARAAAAGTRLSRNVKRPAVASVQEI